MKFVDSFKLSLIFCLSTNCFAALTELQHQRIEQITSVFENSDPEFQYAYIEDIDDGAGITAGRVGFNSNCGSLLDIVKDYTDLKPDNQLAPYLSCLSAIKNRPDYACLFPHVAANVAAKKRFRTRDLVHFDFGKAFVAAANDPIFRKVQDDNVENYIFQPALQVATKLNLHTALGIAMIYDTGIQTGYGGGMGMEGIISRMNTQPTNEVDWMAAYMASRLDTLRHPLRADGTRYEVPLYVSAPRAEAFIEILKAKNYELTAPIKFKYFGQKFDIR